MQIAFGGQSHRILPGAVIGIIGNSGSGVGDLLRAAGGRLIESGSDLDLSPAPVIALLYSLDVRDPAERLIAESAVETLRRSGTVVLIASHHPDVLRHCADELWWIDAGTVRMKGDPSEVMRAYTGHILKRVAAAAAGPVALRPSMRRGDGRAELVAVETLDASGQPAAVWTSGEAVAIRVAVRFRAVVENPVIGIMIRTRVGMEVFGTNTELENVPVGPCAAGDVKNITFRFDCNLCPQYYTVTAASHDPEGVWHDWMEDAIAFTVADTRYTAGVANLRARVEISGFRG